MRNITAYFIDSQSARIAAEKIAGENITRGDIRLFGVESEKVLLATYTVFCIFAGASLGLILGAGVALIPEIGIFAKISAVTGLLSGAAIGAVTGTLLDVLVCENAPTCASVSMEADEKFLGKISKRLKKQGAFKVVLT